MNLARNNIMSSLCFILMIMSVFQAQAAFEGDVILIPEGCEAKQKCLLVLPVRFTDSSGLVWEAPSGLETDGASIPPFFRPILGEPFQESYIKAALIHDHYCGKHVRDWFTTQKAFYEGLVDQGVPLATAKTLLYGVLLGGPKWFSTVSGIDCGKNCINNVVTNNLNPTVIFHESDYQLFDMTSEIKNIYHDLEFDPNKYTLEQIKDLALERRQLHLQNLNQ